MYRVWRYVRHTDVVRLQASRINWTSCNDGRGEEGSTLDRFPHVDCLLHDRRLYNRTEKDRSLHGTSRVNTTTSDRVATVHWQFMLTNDDIVTWFSSSDSCKTPATQLINNIHISVLYLSFILLDLYVCICLCMWLYSLYVCWRIDVPIRVLPEFVTSSS